MSALMHDTLTRLRRLSIVSVAAVEGHAVGGGAELTTATDLRVVTFGTTVRFVHVKLGAAPGWGGAYRLTQLLGHTKALQLLLSAKKLDGDAAVKIGLAQWVAPSGGALAKAVDVLEGYLGASIPEAAVDAAMDAVRRDRSPLGTDATESTSSASASVDDEDAVAHLAAWHHFTADPTAVPWLASTTAAELGATGYSGHSLDSIRAIKTGVIAAMDLPEAEAMQLERDAFASVWGGEHNVAALGRGRASPPLPPPPSS
ncbi:ClpP/crotonase-like domain-containing protein [Blastocladiella britannica]|nr:ClpP/crotonase-like domain-containing protein [Blastocladiella britannica]